MEKAIYAVSLLSPTQDILSANRSSCTSYNMGGGRGRQPTRTKKKQAKTKGRGKGTKLLVFYGKEFLQKEERYRRT